MPITFKEKPAQYMRGRRVNAEEWNGVSRNLEGTTPVPFAVPVIAGAAAKGCLPLTAAAQTVVGITEASQVLPHSGDEYRQYDTVAICETGVIAVLTSAAVTKDSQARFNVTSQAWTGAAASATVLTIPGATFDAAGASGALVPVRYRRPNPSLSAST